MKSKPITVTVVEQPGKIGEQKAATLSRKLQKLLSNPAFLAEVEERMEQNRKAKERKAS